MKQVLWAVVVFLVLLGSSIGIFLPRIFELPGGTKAGIYSNLWLLGTAIGAPLFSWLVYVVLELRKEKREMRRWR